MGDDRGLVFVLSIYLFQNGSTSDNRSLSLPVTGSFLSLFVSVFMFNTRLGFFRLPFLRYSFFFFCPLGLSLSLLFRSFRRPSFTVRLTLGLLLLYERPFSPLVP